MDPTVHVKWLNDFPVFCEVTSTITVLDIAKADDDKAKSKNATFFMKQLPAKKYGQVIRHS